MKKYFTRFTAIFLALLFMAFPAFAVSPWALPELENAVRYGVFPAAWMDEVTIRPVIRSQLGAILSGTAERLSVSYSCSEGEEICTRGDVLRELYALLCASDRAGQLGCSSDTDYVSFMTSHGIVVGNGDSLSLDGDCTLEMAAMFAFRVTDYACRTLGIGSRGMMWKATNHRVRVYLFAAEYTAGVPVFPLAPSVLDAMEEAKCLLIASDAGQDGAVEAILPYAAYQDGSKLSDHLSEELYGQVIEALKKHGYLEDIIADFKPWFLTLLLESLQAGAGKSDAPDLTLEPYFCDAFRQNEREIRELMPLEKQAAVLDGFSDELQEFLLRRALKGGGGGRVSDERIRLWMAGDGRAYAAHLTKYPFIDSASEQQAKLAGEYDAAVRDARIDAYTETLKEVLESKASGVAVYFAVLDASLCEDVANAIAAGGYRIQPVS